MNTSTIEPALFVEFPKISRLSREAIVTEKLDGTNAQIWISEDMAILKAGSRNRWLTLDADNYGFAKWVIENATELAEGLGPGRHFGEWWGQGIQRGYGLTEKRFSLFNTIRWCLHGDTPQLLPSGDPEAEPKYQQVLPACVGLVPVLYRGVFDTSAVSNALQNLQLGGSVAAPGFMKPEGVVVFHIAANVMFKKTIEKDAEYKGKR